MAVFVLFLLSVPFYAADPTLSAEIKPSADGKTVTVIFAVENNPGIAGFRFTMNYDNTVLKPVSAAMNGNITGLFYDNHDSATNLFNVVWVFSGTQYTGNGELCSAVFSVIGTVKDGKYPITVTYDPADLVKIDPNAPADQNVKPVSFGVRGLTASALTVSVQSDQSKPVPSASTGSQAKSSTTASVFSAVSSEVFSYTGSVLTSMTVEINSQIPAPDYTGSQTSGAAVQQSAQTASNLSPGTSGLVSQTQAPETQTDTTFPTLSQPSGEDISVQTPGNQPPIVLVIAVSAIAVAAVIVLIILTIKNKKNNRKSDH